MLLENLLILFLEHITVDQRYVFLSEQSLGLSGIGPLEWYFNSRPRQVQGVDGAIFQMISHGFISGALFLCVGVIYDRAHTRDIGAFGGLDEGDPVIADDVTYYVTYTYDAETDEFGTGNDVAVYSSHFGVSGDDHDPDIDSVDLGAVRDAEKYRNTYHQQNQLAIHLLPDPDEQEWNNGPPQFHYYSDTAEIALEDVRVPQANLVGKEGQGFRELMHFFDTTRVMVAAQALGLSEACLETSVKYVKERTAFGAPLGSYQLTQMKLTEMAIRIEALRGLVLKAAWLIDEGRPDYTLAAMAKFFGGQTAVFCANYAVELHGGYGYIEEYPVQKWYRDAKILELYEGTKEAEIMTIGRYLQAR